MANSIMASSKPLISLSSSTQPTRVNLPKSIKLPQIPKPISSSSSSSSLSSKALSFSSATVKSLALIAALAPPSMAEAMEKAQLFDFNLTLPIIVVEFLFLMFALDKVYYSPLGNFMDKRDGEIKEKLASVKDTSTEVKALDEQAAAVMRAARAEIAAALNKMKKETEVSIICLLSSPSLPSKALIRRHNASLSPSLLDMDSKIAPQKPDDSEYEIIEGGSESALATGASPWMNSATLKLRHRIGRGPFGDVWLATHHQSTEDYDEHHEVAIKMLHPIKEDQRKVVVDKFEDLFSKCQGVESVCMLRGVSSISGRICIIMKFYEGCVGDKMARLKGGKLSLPDVLRYGVDLVTGILELHSKGFLILNLKPSNFLLSDNDKAILGDVGVPYLLLSIPLPSSDMTMRLGTANYMAPEQWQPELRGPMSFETDSWGFGCSVVEMLTGVQPWSGKSADEIYDLVVRKQEKISIPSGVPPPLENLLRGCFMYDLRSRPSMTDILHVLKSLQDSEEEEVWRGIDSREIRKSSAALGYTEWFLSKDQLRVGDTVRSRKPANSFKHENMDVPEGTVVGLERDTDPDEFALVKVHGVHDPLRVHVSVLERVTNGLAAGDWVRLKDGEDKRHSLVGVIHSIDREGNVAVGFIGLPTLWKGTSSQLQMAKGYSVGQFVKIKANVVIPRFKWMRKGRGIWATGRISKVLPNGCLEVEFPGALPFGEEHGSSCLADPAEVEVVDFNTCEGVVKKYQHLEDFHWAVRPLLIAMGLLTAMKLGLFVGKKAGRSKDGKQRDGSGGQGGDCQIVDGQDSGKSKWLVFSV
ncbi:unnamed protein product [Brassica rapa subsp. trilocularis]